jgi:hypothetical protein
MPSRSSFLLMSMVGWLFAGAFLLALVLIFLSTLLEKKNDERSGTIFKRLLGHLLRDVAVAFFVALMVTGLYEGYVKEKLQIAQRAKDYTELLQSHVPDEVWSALNANVINNPRIRRNVRIIFRLQPDNSLSPCRALLWMNYSYGLYGLGHNSTSYMVRHDVVGHFSDKGYPRFESASVLEPLADGKFNSQNYDGPRLDKENKRISFWQDVSLQPSYDYDRKKYDDSKAVQVNTVRYEVIELPGIYPLGMPELIDGPVEVYFIIPDSLNIVPEVHTQWAGIKFKPVGNRKFIYEGKEEEGNLWRYEGILLPGQTCLIYFKDAAIRPELPPPPAHPS